MLLKGSLSCVEKSRKLAGKFFKRGYNCAQAVILAVSQAREIKVPKELVKSASAFSGGIGYSGCLCGALAGATLLIGFLSSSKQKEAAEFYRIFKEKFGSSCCRVLRKGIEFKDPNLKKHCAKITEETAALLTQFLGG